MFDLSALPTMEAVASLDATACIDAIADAARLEAAAMARRLAAMAALYDRREDDAVAGGREHWVVDGWAEVSAEIAAAQHISRGRAAGLLETAVALRKRLPKVADVLADGRADYRVVRTIVSRTSQVVDADKMAIIDGLLAKSAARWTKVSDKKLDNAIDGIVVSVDVLAKKTTRSADDDRGFGIGPDRDGLTEIWGTVCTADALGLDGRVNAIADTVCARDPRTKMRRLADAFAVLGVQDRLACQCGREDCPVAGDIPRRRDVVIHIMADEATVRSDGTAPGFISGYGFLDSEAVREVAQSATLRNVRHPGEGEVEKSYRPSTALAEFVRLRDLTCRFPGCTTSAEVCEIDHTMPWPYGPTHPSNLKLLCKTHHLLKTFYSGPNLWGDKQLPDGTVVWTSPTGHTYTTTPDGALFFPVLGRPTGKLDLPAEPPVSPDRGAMMPIRKRTRADERRARIEHERGVNARRIAADPPPF